MNIWVIGEPDQCQKFCHTTPGIHCVQSTNDIDNSIVIDAIIDLAYNGNVERKQLLMSLGSEIIFINDVINPLTDADEQLVRFNGWNGFLENGIIEASYYYEQISSKAIEIFACFNKQLKWVKNIPGFISLRVIVSVINEAYHTWGDGIATVEAIDTAMLYGTNYPQGPFGWARQLGSRNVYLLLEKMKEENSLYEPAHSLVQEIQ